MICKLQDLSGDLRDSRRIVLAVVFTALLLDNFLLTVVVPVIPGYLISLVETSDHNINNNATWDTYGRNGSGNVTLPWTEARNKTQLKLWQAVLYKHENGRIGWLLASKALVQLLVNPVVGPLINRYGCGPLMTIGMVLLLISSLLFAFGRGYSVLFAARTLHGFSSPCIAIAGLSLLARMYPEDKERSRAMGIALGGLGIGVILGYPFGGLSLYFLGKPATFVTIAVLVLCQIIFQCVALQDSKKSEVSLTGTSLSQLVKDPYILICAGIILVPEMTMALIESTVPIWLIENFHPPNWELGTVFVPDSIGFWIACNLFGFVAVSIGRWRCNMVSLLCIGTCLFCIPLVSNISHLIIPHFGIGLSLGIIDASLLPMMALLVDNRHVVEYGNVYAITQVAISLGFALGPILGSLLVPSVGFSWLMRAMGLLNFLCIPLCVFLKSPPSSEETFSILRKDSSLPSSETQEQSGFIFNRLSEED